MLTTTPTFATTLRFVRLSVRAATPTYQTDLAAGMDLAACLPEGVDSLQVAPGAIQLVPTGLSIAIEPGFEGQVRPRSGLASKHGITLINSPGTIDADYRGEVKVPLINLGKEPFAVMHGMRIAQLIIAPIARASVEEVESLDTTSRGEGGFGSTGVR